MDDGELMGVLREMQAESEAMPEPGESGDEATDYVRAKIATIRRNVRQFQARHQPGAGESPRDAIRATQGGPAAPDATDLPPPAAVRRRAPCDTMSAHDRKGLPVQHFSDRLATAIRARRSVVCVGLDPALERMPRELVEKYRPQAAELGRGGGRRRLLPGVLHRHHRRRRRRRRLRQAAGGLLRAVRRRRLARPAAPSSSARTSTTCR